MIKNVHKRTNYTDVKSKGKCLLNEFVTNSLCGVGITDTKSKVKVEYTLLHADVMFEFLAERHWSYNDASTCVSAIFLNAILKEKKLLMLSNVNHKYFVTVWPNKCSIFFFIYRRSSMTTDAISRPIINRISQWLVIFPLFLLPTSSYLPSWDPPSIHLECYKLSFLIWSCPNVEWPWKYIHEPWILWWSLFSRSYCTQCDAVHCV